MGISRSHLHCNTHPSIIIDLLEKKTENHNYENNEMSEERFQIEQIEPKEELNLDFVNQHEKKENEQPDVGLQLSKALIQSQENGGINLKENEFFYEKCEVCGDR